MHRVFVGDKMEIDLKKLIISVLIPLVVGFLSSFLIKNQIYLYDMLTKPLLAPPSIIFPIVWTILYILMGVSFYLIWNNKNTNIDAFIAYGLQLFFNFFWPILFFNAGLLFVSFVWILLLGIVLIDTIYIFFKENPLAGVLLVPYLIWLTFATYLNGMIYLLN